MRFGVLRQAHVSRLAAFTVERRRARRARRIVHPARRVPRAGRGVHAADVRERRRVRRRGHDDRFARARRLVRADRRARAPERRGADRRRARAGQRRAGRDRETTSLVGGNCGVYEGTIVRARAVLGAGVVLTRGTPVFDLVHERCHPGASRVARSRFPTGAVVVPGARAVASGWGAEQGSRLADAGHREVPRREDRPRHRAGAMAAMTATRLRVAGEFASPATSRSRTAR